MRRIFLLDEEVGSEHFFFGARSLLPKGEPKPHLGSHLDIGLIEKLCSTRIQRCIERNSVNGWSAHRGAAKSH